MSTGPNSTEWALPDPFKFALWLSRTHPSIHPLNFSFLAFQYQLCWKKTLVFSIEMLRTCGSAFTRAGMLVFSNKHKVFRLTAGTTASTCHSSELLDVQRPSYRCSPHMTTKVTVNDCHPSCCAFYSALYSVGRLGGTFTQILHVVLALWHQYRIPNKSTLRKMIVHKPSPPKHPQFPRVTTPLTSHSSFN